MVTPTGPKPSTIYDVARVAQVSHQTVSRYLKGYEGIRPGTRERVEKALVQLDYRPNVSARVLATNRPFVVVALTDTIAQVGPASAASGAAVAAREAGYLLDVLAVEAGDLAETDRALATTIQRDIAGVLAFALTDVMAAAVRRLNLSVPLYIAAENEEISGSHPAGLNGRGLSALVEHLVDLGHTRFFHIAGPRDSVAARNREVAYEWSLAAHGLRSLGTAHGNWSSSSGYEAEKIAAAANPTAIIAGNDQMALGAMLSIAQRGLRVPEDVSVTGFDDVPEAAFYNPPLTTVRTDFQLQGRAGFEHLLALIEQRPPRDLPKITAELMTRASTAPPPD